MSTPSEKQLIRFSPYLRRKSCENRTWGTEINFISSLLSVCLSDLKLLCLKHRPEFMFVFLDYEPSLCLCSRTVAALPPSTSRCKHFHRKRCSTLNTSGVRAPLQAGWVCKDHFITSSDLNHKETQGVRSVSSINTFKDLTPTDHRSVSPGLLHC